MVYSTFNFAPYLADRKPDEEETILDPDRSESGNPQPPKPIDKSPVHPRPAKGFKPIILCLAFAVLLVVSASAQVEGAVRLGMQYSDNVFQLSDYDLDRFQTNHPNLGYVETTDDLILSTRLDLAYPLHYRWWRFTPSVTANFAQAVSNTDKYNPNFLTRLRVDRYYWNATVLYGYYPYVHVRSYVDSDGTGELETYSYERNLYRGDANIHLIKNGTAQLHFRYEEYFYNRYFTEFDGTATTGGIGWRHRFPTFSVDVQYRYRVFDNDDRAADDDRDSSYESDIYELGITLKPMPLSDSRDNIAQWQPSLTLGYEERFFQSADSWYGGRIDKIYTTNAGFLLDLSEKININLDYTHVFRNIDSPNALVRELREYSENRIGASVEYMF